MLTVSDLTYRIGGRSLLEHATATVPPGHKAGLVGRNGTGKSTLLQLIAGQLDPDEGLVEVHRSAKIGMLAQKTPGGELTPREFVLAADRERSALLAEAKDAKNPERIAEIQIRLSDIGAETAPARAAAILAGLGFNEDAQKLPLSTFSGGWRMRVALAATLFLQPDLLLLDEPSNHLDLESRFWLESHLVAYRGTILLVSHDRNFLNSIVDTIIHLNDRKLTIYRGNYDQFEKERSKRLDLLASERTKQLRNRQHIQSFIDRFRYKASKARQAQSRLKALARMGEIEQMRPESEVEFNFPDPNPMAPPLITVENASVGYSAQSPVLTQLNLRLDMDDRIALLGENGNGKTTLLRLLKGELRAMSGVVTNSPKLCAGYFSQQQTEAFNQAGTALDELGLRMPDATETQLRAQLGRFGITRDRADVKTASLSGGELAKLLFACVTRDAPHILLLDEPTNHLDMASRQALIDAINGYQGAVVLVTHDLHLVELCADRLWVVRQGTCRVFDGDIWEYRKSVLEARRAERRLQREQRPERHLRQSRRDARRAGADARAARSERRRVAAEAERRIEALSREKSVIEKKLAEPELYEGSAIEIVELNKQLGDLEKRISAAESEWLHAVESTP